MKKILSLLCFCTSTILCLANDGAFYTKGNQLIPIQETDILVQKEILTLKKINNSVIEVTVYYEFFNPKEAKTLTVGFEAFAPVGDVDGGPINGRHPYIEDFTVLVNNEILPFDVAYVDDSLYTKQGQVQSIDLNHFEGSTSGNYIDFYYVYHFKAKFKKGLNVVKHTYTYDVSGGVCYNYEFEYVLTAANRWGNGQIDDFTLIIDNGEFETFDIAKTWFNGHSNWIINGIGKMENHDDHLTFHIRKGSLIFQKKQFKPKGELFIESILCSDEGEPHQTLPYSYYSTHIIPEPKTEFEKKVLRNLPFARRGYVFKNTALRQFYEKIDWYLPNPNYIPNLNTLTEAEKKWYAKYQ